MERDIEYFKVIFIIITEKYSCILLVGSTQEQNLVQILVLDPNSKQVKTSHCRVCALYTNWHVGEEICLQKNGKFRRKWWTP
jgi:hypothetical protein